MAPLDQADLLKQLGVERPVVQAGMAGGVAGGELAGAVSAAGALGTVGMMGASAFASALAQARARAGGKPVAANLLIPFVTSDHVRACAEADVALVVLHGGRSRRWLTALRSRGLRVLVTVGTPQQAVCALADGADGLVVQGLEAGGHLLGVEPTHLALTRIREVTRGAPLLAAGGVAAAADVRRLLDLGAQAAVAGTRFLLTEESRAHDGYKQRVLGARRTLATDLFGLGWPLRHRVVPNAATERWCRTDERGPWPTRLLGRIGAPVGRIVPMEQMGRLAALQRVGVPVFSPALPLAGMPDAMIDRCALYAGETAARIGEIVPAATALDALHP
jgi:NAD(P)H-dependent flavin oxidoreductase YrpB (nitropropane dioxygenase family)